MVNANDDNVTGEYSDPYGKTKSFLKGTLSPYKTKARNLKQELWF